MYYHRIRKPFESYDKELLEDGYPESSQYLQRLLAVKNETGERDTALIKDKALLNRTMTCFKHMESCQRDRCKWQGFQFMFLQNAQSIVISAIISFKNQGSTTEAIDNLLRLADEMTKLSDGIACVFYEIMLDKMKEIDCAELSKCTLQYSFGRFLVKVKDYEKANKILKEALERSEENNVSVVTICNALVLIFH